MDQVCASLHAVVTGPMNETWLPLALMLSLPAKSRAAVITEKEDRDACTGMCVSDKERGADANERPFLL